MTQKHILVSLPNSFDYYLLTGCNTPTFANSVGRSVINMLVSDLST